MLKSNDIVLRGNEQKIKYTKIRFDPIPPGTSGGCSRTIHSLAFCFEGRFMFLLFVLLVSFHRVKRFPSLFWHWLPFHRRLFLGGACFRYLLGDKRIQVVGPAGMFRVTFDRQRWYCTQKRLLRFLLQRRFFWDRFALRDLVEECSCRSGVFFLFGKGNCFEELSWSSRWFTDSAEIVILLKVAEGSSICLQIVVTIALSTIGLNHRLKQVSSEDDLVCYCYLHTLRVNL